MGAVWSIVMGCGLLVATAGILGTWLGRARDRRSPDEPAQPFAEGHEAPEEPFTAERAHEVMRAHRSCRADTCARKAAAFRVLVAAGRMVPDSRADRYSL